MGKLTETLFPLLNSMDNNSVSTVSPTAEATLFNFMENFEADTTDLPPSICRMHLPTWLNLWCVFISVSVLMLLVILGILVRYIQVQKQRIIHSEIVHGKLLKIKKRLIVLVFIKKNFQLYFSISGFLQRTLLRS